VAAPAALLLTWLLFLLMMLAIRGQESTLEPPTTIEDVRVVQTERDETPQPTR